MDTRYWGPTGWHLLHSVVSNYPENPTQSTRDNYKIFLHSLPNVLPCIYCRNSCIEYYKKNPLKEKHLNSGLELHKWLYNIHNLVNNKLRKQGLIKFNDPLFSEVIIKYNNVSCDFLQNNIKFLYSIVLNFPDDSQLITNIQLYNYQIFFEYLIKILPNNIIKYKLEAFNGRYPVKHFLNNRQNITKWLYVFENILSTTCPCLEDRCRQVEKYRAGCKGNDSDVKPTCRRLKLTQS